MVQFFYFFRNNHDAIGDKFLFFLDFNFFKKNLNRRDNPLHVQAIFRLKIFCCPQGGLKPASDIEFSENIIYMRFNRMETDA